MFTSFFRSNKQAELFRVLGAMGASLSYFDGQSEEEKWLLID